MSGGLWCLDAPSSPAFGALGRRRVIDWWPLVHSPERLWVGSGRRRRWIRTRGPLAAVRVEKAANRTDGPRPYPPGSPPLTYEKRRCAAAFYAVDAVELRPRQAPHEVAFTIRDAVSTAGEAAVPGVDPRRLVVRAVPRQQQRLQHDRFICLMCDSDHVKICTKSLDHACCCFARSASGSVIKRDRLSTRSVDEHLVWMASSSERDGTAASHTSSSL
jgi:hypothetical protein